MAKIVNTKGTVRDLHRGIVSMENRPVTLTYNKVWGAETVTIALDGKEVTVDAKELRKLLDLR